MNEITFFEKNNSTHAQIEKEEGDTTSIGVANFTAAIVKEILDDQENISWKLRLKSKSGSAEVEISGKDLVNPYKLRDKAGNRGAFLYQVVNAEVHSAFMQYLFDKQKYSTVKKTDFLGRIEPDVFLFCNAMATADGMKSLENYLVPPEGSLYFRESALDLKEVILKFVQVYGTQAWKAVGFAVGSLYVEEIAEHFGFFPVLFLYGRKGSGKNTLAEIIRAFFGAHKEIRPFNFNSTAKSIQRSGARYKGIPIVINEYQNNPKNNMLISSFYDREGYHRARQDSVLGIQKGEVNSTLIVLGTQDISGKESEAVLSRLVEIDMDEVKRDKGLVDDFREQRDSLCLFLEHSMMRLSSGIVMRSIKESIARNMKVEADARIMENYSIIQGAANIFFQSLGLKSLVVEDIQDEILKWDRVTREANSVDIFIHLVEAMIADGNHKIKHWARVLEESREVAFNLDHLYPIIVEEAKKSGVEMPDKRTIKNGMKNKGAESRAVKIGGNIVKVWVIKRGEGEFFKGEQMEAEGVENFLSLLESMIHAGSNEVRSWAKIVPLENISAVDLLFNLKHCYPLVLEEGRKRKLFVSDMKSLRRRIKAMGAVSKAAGIGSRIVKVWGVRREGKR